MGLIRDLISNFANARSQEAQQKAAEQAQLADIYKFTYQNHPDPQMQALALKDWMAILGHSGGPQGKEMAEKLEPVLQTQMQVRNAKRLAQGGGIMPGLAGQGMQEPNLQRPAGAPPAGGSPATPSTLATGSPTGFTSFGAQPPTATGEMAALPQTSVEAGTQAADQAEERMQPQVRQVAARAGAAAAAKHGARSFLQTLAGVGENLMGIPRQQPGMQIDPRIRPPTAAEIAQNKTVGDEAARAERAKIANEHPEWHLTGDALTRWIITGTLPSDFGKTATTSKLTPAEQTLKDALQAAQDEKTAKGGGPLTAAEKYAVEQKVQTKAAAGGLKLTGRAGQLDQIDKILEYAKTHPGEYSDQEIKDLQAARDAAQRAPVGVQTLDEAKKDAADIADGIKRGIGDPMMTNVPRQTKQIVEAQLAREGFNLRAAQNDLFIMRHHLAAMNSVQQLRLREATSFSVESLNLVDNPQSPGKDMIGDLRKAVSRTDFPVLNKAALAAAKNGLYGPAATKAATLLEAQIGDLQSEIAVVYMGGNSPTDKGLEQAQKILKSEWTDDTLRGAVNLARRNLGLRLNSINQAQPMGLSSQGRELFGPGGASETPTAAAQKPIQIGDKYYIYKGSGPKNDLNNWTEVKQ